MYCYFKTLLFHRSGRSNASCKRLHGHTEHVVTFSSAVCTHKMTPCCTPYCTPRCTPRFTPRCTPRCMLRRSEGDIRGGAGAGAAAGAARGRHFRSEIDARPNRGGSTRKLFHLTFSHNRICISVLILCFISPHHSFVFRSVLKLKVSRLHEHLVGWNPEVLFRFQIR